MFASAHRSEVMSHQWPKNERIYHCGKGNAYKPPATIYGVPRSIGPGHRLGSWLRRPHTSFTKRGRTKRKAIITEATVALISPALSALVFAIFNVLPRLFGSARHAKLPDVESQVASTPRNTNGGGNASDDPS